jgi:predicted enzyme related to lactoylglutathione lyase
VSLKLAKSLKEDIMLRGRVMWFELPADDPKRAIAFYEKVYGWTRVKWEGPFDYWQITTGPDTNRV